MADHDDGYDRARLVWVDRVKGVLEMGPDLLLDGFQGPLDLLLHLIETEEIDIHAIPIAHITDQYLTYLRASTLLHIEIATEFLVMAATLFALKARSLLPRPPEPEEMESDESAYAVTESDLAQLLMEYRAYKRVAGKLATLERETGQRIGRLPMPLAAQLSGEASLQVSFNLGKRDPEDLRNAYRRMLERTERDDDVRVLRDRESIAERIKMIEQTLKRGPRSFESLLRHRSRREIATVLVCVLELARQNRTEMRQEKPFGEIWIQWIKSG